MSRDDRRLDDREVALVLRKASEVRRGEPDHGRERGLTVAELKNIAAEVGITPDRIDRAVESLDLEPLSGQGFLGAPIRFHVTDRVPGRVPREKLEELIRVIRRETRSAGTVEHVLSTLEWRAKDSFGTVHVSVAPDEEDTRVEVMSARTDEAVVLGILPILGGAFLGLAVGGQLFPELHAAVLGLAAAGTGGGWVTARHLWRQRARRWMKDAEQLARTVATAAERLAGRTDALSASPTEPDDDPLGPA